MIATSLSMGPGACCACPLTEALSSVGTKRQQVQHLEQQRPAARASAHHLLGRRRCRCTRRAAVPAAPAPAARRCRRPRRRAGLLLLPLLLIPHGSGGLLSQKAVLHHALSHYQDQDDPPPADEEAAAAGGGSGAAEGSLTQPLLEPGMQREAAGDAAAAPTMTVAGAGHGGTAEGDEGSEADHELAAAIAASLREAEAAGLAGSHADGADGQLDLEPAVLDSNAPDLITFEAAVPDDSAPAPHSAEPDGLAPPPAAVAFALPPAAAASAPSAGADHASRSSQRADGRPPSPFAEPGPQAQLPPELSPMQCLRSSDFWLLFLVLAIGMGSGLTLVNNLSQLVKALTGGASAMDTTPVLVSAFSVCNCAGEAACVCRHSYSSVLQGG